MTKVVAEYGEKGKYWSGKGDLNPRPSPWQGDALPLSYSRSFENFELILVGTLEAVKQHRIEYGTLLFLSSMSVKPSKNG